MKLIIIFLLCALPLVQQAQTKADSSNITAVLSKFPAHSKQQYDDNVQQLQSLGEKDMERMISMLTAPGDSNNVPIEYAISAYSSSVMLPGKEAERNKAIGIYCSSLNILKNDVFKQFIIVQLQLIGNDHSLICLQPYLKDEKLAGAAARAIAQTNTPAAGKLLMNAYASSKDKASVIEGLGYMNYAPARSLIGSAYKNADSSIKKMSLYALKRIDQASGSVPFKLSKEEKKEKYRVLFDGTDLNEWVGDKKGYTAEKNEIVIKPAEGAGGNLFTKDEFGDFIFRFEFMLTPGANNGLGIRAPLEGDAAYQGMELQILDNESAIYKDLHPYQYHGSVYGVIPAKRGFLRPTGQWNYQEVLVKGTKIKVTLNNTIILDGDIQDARDNGTPDGSAHPGLKRDKGHIGFLGHGSVVRFRNIRIKQL
jgi:hypothetical protein